MTATDQNVQIANTILTQVGTMVRGCLDMGRRCYAIPNGVVAKNAIIGYTDQRMVRGDIKITLNGKDLYDITLIRTTKAKGPHVTKEWHDVSVSELRPTLDSIWR